MSAGQSRLLSSAVYHAPIPVLALDAGPRVVDYNVALEALVGSPVRGRRDQSLGEFLGIITPRGEGSALPSRLRRRGAGAPAPGPEGDPGPGDQAECIFHSEDFGP